MSECVDFAYGHDSGSSGGVNGTVVLVVASGDRIGTSLCFSKSEGRAVRHC